MCVGPVSERLKAWSEREAQTDNERDTANAQERRSPEHPEADAKMGRDEVDDPVRRQGSNAKDNQVGDEVGLVGLNAVFPLVDAVPPFGRGDKQGGAQQLGHDIAERGA